MSHAAVEVGEAHDRPSLASLFKINSREGPSPGSVGIHAAYAGGLDKVVLSEQQRVAVELAARFLARAYRKALRFTFAFAAPAVLHSEMLLTHSGQKHADVQVFGAEPLQKDRVVLFRAHQVNVVVAGDPFFLTSGCDRPDPDHHGLLLFGLKCKALDAWLPEK